MFRISHLVLRQTTQLAIRRSPLEIHVAYINRTAVLYSYKRPGVKHRETCVRIPPCPPKPPDDRLFWGALAALLVTGAFAVYAKNSPEIRDWLSIRAPWFDDFLAAIYQDEAPIGESLKKAAANFVFSTRSFVNNLFEKPEECCMEGEPPPSCLGPPPPEPPEPPPPLPARCLTSGGGGGDDVPDDDEEEECEIILPPVVTKDVCEIEKCLTDLGDDIYHNLLTARDSCKFYNNLVESNMKDFTPKALKELETEMEARNKLVKKSTEKAEKLSMHMNDLRKYMECGVVVPPDRLEVSRKLMADYDDKIERTRIEYVLESEESVFRDQQWQKVRDVTSNFQDLQKAGAPSLDYSAKKIEFTDDLDFFLIQSMKYKQKLKDEHKEAQTVMTSKANRCLDYVKEMPPRERDAKLASGIRKGTADAKAEYNQNVSDLKARNDAEHKKALKKQLQKHEQMLEKKLAEREKEDAEKFDMRVEKKVKEAKKEFAADLAKMDDKIKEVEEKLEERLKIERDSKRAAELYEAGSKIVDATKKGLPNVKVDKELETIQKNATEDDKLVNTVLKSIPQKVWEEGVDSESCLKEKYDSMEDVARKVALLENEGGPMPLYAMSWVQDALLFMKPQTIPQKEIDEPLKEPFKGLDTFDLLQRARYFMEQGNIAKALRYVDSLEGASRGAAESWYSAASAHVQTKQAAEAIMAHAIAMNARNI